ncbi:MarR family winged helix-turn-helix transcriptional regulator [Flexivirga oryzae]|uniref:DNA-binding MarR family transcriptional regulator n=1 Tax=Flexivirga oryzae TaxID=1794944 RepID=A0A839N6H8_9MICO|nr:MarR family winged helix-turn-helix transcriptional regulator [Flexivirga oryzae]MBB2892877.1 DNA-binding MarR family transcriptional regulator [Flexivirga oryzae]
MPYSPRHAAAPGGPDDQPSLSHLVMHAARALRRSSRSELEPFGLTPSQGRALGVVARYGATPPRLGDIAARLDIAPRSATEVVDDLQERGLVERAPDPADRRAVTIRLTDEGRVLRQRIEQVRARRGDEFFGHLSPEQRDTLRDLLQQALAPHEASRHPGPHRHHH